ncbi:hypothetical protein CB1_000336004 [Camelus ferus]|nr:hypothetical protein CB1_000336004 [Camelus ferus]
MTMATLPNWRFQELFLLSLINDLASAQLGLTCQPSPCNLFQTNASLSPATSVPPASTQHTTWACADMRAEGHIEMRVWLVAKQPLSSDQLDAYISLRSWINAKDDSARISRQRNIYQALQF